MNSMPATLERLGEEFGVPNERASRVTLRTCLKHHYLRFARIGFVQANTSPSPVLGDKFDPCGFKCMSDREIIRPPSKMSDLRSIQHGE